MAQQATFRGSRQQLYQRLVILPAQLAGRLPDPTGTVDRLWKAVGIEGLAIIREEFLEKARGGTDAAGITWKPLDPRTVAYKRRHPGLNRRRNYADRKGRGKRPLLTAEQDRLWRSIYSREIRRQLAAGAGQQDAAAQAAVLAWSVVKRRGGQTILMRYGKADVEIGRDTGRLFASLSPGNSDNRLTVSGPGRISVGTNVAYAKHFHAKRPLWPSDGNLPEPWRQRLLGVLEDGIQDVVRGLVERIANG